VVIIGRFHGGQDAIGWDCTLSLSAALWMDIGDKKSSYIAFKIPFNTLLNMNKYKIILVAHCAHQAFETHVI
jgi:hypothetical protein